MLFYLDDSVINKLNQTNIQNALNNLGHAIKCGMHILYCERRTLESLYNSEFLDSETRNIFRKLFLNCSEMKEYMKQVKGYIKLVVTSKCVNKEINNNNKYVICMPVDYLIDMRLLSEVMIICEDIDDYDVYKKIIEYYLYNNKLSKINVRLNEISGSGSGISNSFIKKIRENKYFVIAIADTDKKAPKDEIGNTLRDLIEEYKEVQDYCLGEIFYSNFSEVENLVPIYIYEKQMKLLDEEIKSYAESAVTTYCNNKKNKISFRDFLLIIHREKREDMTNYFDFKKGLNMKTFNKSKNVKRYWEDVLYAAGLNNEILEDLNNNEDIIDKFAKRPLKKVINILNKELIENISSKIDEDKKKLWDEIGQFLYSWGCAPTSQMRVM